MTKKLYVGNLPDSCTEQEVRDLFVEYGEIASLDWLTDRDTGNFRGFCFVEMDAEESANAAIQGLDGWDFNGRNLKVNEAQPREDRPRRDRRSL